MKNVERLEREQRLEMATNQALQREADRHAAAVDNMHRLRALRLERDQTARLICSLGTVAQSRL